MPCALTLSLAIDAIEWDGPPWALLIIEPHSTIEPHELDVTIGLVTSSPVRPIGLALGALDHSLLVKFTRSSHAGWRQCPSLVGTTVCVLFVPCLDLGVRAHSRCAGHGSEAEAINKEFKLEERRAQMQQQRGGPPMPPGGAAAFGNGGTVECPIEEMSDE